jgi:hypothetical protein
MPCRSGYSSQLTVDGLSNRKAGRSIREFLYFNPSDELDSWMLRAAEFVPRIAFRRPVSEVWMRRKQQDASRWAGRGMARFEQSEHVFGPAPVSLKPG